MTATYSAKDIFSSLSARVRAVRRWEKAGIISPAQRDAILAFEKTRHGKKMIRSLIGLALLAIAIGVLSIVAANWAHIPGMVKIGMHAVLNAAAALTMWQAARRDNKWWREGATVLFFALNLTLIILIGQVFQLSGNYSSALSLWMVISTPAVMLYGRTAMNAVPWFCGLIAAIFCVLSDLAEHMPDLAGFLLVLAVTLFLPLFLFAGGSHEKLQAARPHWTVTAFRAAIVLLAGMATFASLGWYADMTREMERTLSSAGSFAAGYAMMLAVCAAAPIAVYAYEWLRTQKHGRPADRTGFIFVIGSLASIVLPLVLLPREIPFLAAVHFIGYWGFLGWVGYRLGYEQLVSNAIILITLRIIIVYLELFGGLLTTGIGLVFSGILLLAMLQGVKKLMAGVKSLSYGGGSDDIQ